MLNVLWWTPACAKAVAISARVVLIGRVTCVIHSDGDTVHVGVAAENTRHPGQPYADGVLRVLQLQLEDLECLLGVTSMFRSNMIAVVAQIAPIC